MTLQDLLCGAKERMTGLTLHDLKQGARQHLMDSTGLFVVSTPLGAFLENVLAGMSDEVSIKSRATVGALYLLGLGGALGYGRDISRNFFTITDKTEDVYQQAHDMVYVGATTAVINPLIYLGAGAHDWEEIGIATFYATLVALGSGGLMGYSVDLFRDLTNYKPSFRVPEAIRALPSGIKKTMAAGIFAASIGLAGLIYSMTQDETALQVLSKAEQVLEQYVR